jgi:RNA polymerase sigma factor (sigma-70 family)
VLVRRASSIRPPGMVASWLYGVARRTALQARRRNARRREIERTAVSQGDGAMRKDADVAELLDREIANLPEKLREAILLCDVQGRTRREDAKELEVAEGTIASRVARGRQILSKRLVRQGVTITTASLAVALPQQALAEVSSSLVSTTVKVAAGRALASTKIIALTEGVIRAMLLSKLRTVLAIVVSLGLVLGGIGLQAGAGGQTKLPDPQLQVQQPKADQLPRPATIKIDADIESVDKAGHTLSAVDMTGAPASGVEVQLHLKGNDGQPIKVQAKLVIDQKRPKLANLPISKDARITDHGKDAKLDDVRPGKAELELAVGPTGLQVVAIRMTGKKPPK